MNRIIPYIFILSGLLSLIITLTFGAEKELTEYNFEICLDYDTCFANFRISIQLFRLFLILYYSLITIIALRNHRYWRFKKTTAVLHCVFLSFPLLFFTFMNNYPLETASIWEKLFPFYTMPQNYIYIAVDCIRFLNLLLLLNIVFLIYFLKSNYNST